MDAKAKMLIVDIFLMLHLSFVRVLTSRDIYIYIGNISMVVVGTYEY